MQLGNYKLKISYNETNPYAYVRCSDGYCPYCGSAP